MKAIKIPVEGKAKIIEIENELEALQKAVGGRIETVTLGKSCCLIVDEEGRLKDKPVNPNASRAFSPIGYPLVGDVLVCGVEYDHFVDIPAEVIVWAKERCII